MKRISRRRFLREGSASLAAATAAWIGGRTAGRALAAGATAERAAIVSPELVDLLATVVADLERKFPYAAALMTSLDGHTLRRDRTGRNVSEIGFRGRGVCLRVFDGEAFHEAATSDLGAGALRAAAAGLVRDVPLARERFRIAALPPLERSWGAPLAADPPPVPLERKSAAMDAEYEALNWNDPRVRNVSLTMEGMRSVRIFVDRTRRLTSETNLVMRGLWMFGLSGGRPGSSFLRKAGQGGPSTSPFGGEEIESARRELVDTFGAAPLAAGTYDVIFDPAVTGLLAHESFGHGVEMDQFVKERARARSFLGKQVASEIVSLSDDPSVPDARGSYPFDDEGMLAAPTRIIENGVFRRPLSDLMSATFLHAERSANGRTQAYDRKVYARMSNTFIERGTSEPAALFADLSDGLHIEGFRNGIEDPQGWGIQFTARLAREVKNGKPTGRVFAPVTITGYVPEILGNVTMVGNEFALNPGSCGKGFKEFVPITSGGPHIRTRARVS